MNNVMNMLPQIKQNPIAMLRRIGYNVPAGLNDPNRIIQHLIQSGQINQGQLDYAQRMARMMGMK